MQITQGWLKAASATQRRALAAASLGWMLDSMDVMIYAMILPAVQKEMHLTSAMSGAMMSATLIAAAIGGIFFGWFADRMGRTRALNGSMLLYSIATMMCGFTHTAMALAACRVLLGLGMGGEWAAGAALVAETFPAEARGKALAFVQSFWAIGYALGAAITAVLLPHYGWRAVFFAGIIPAFLTLWVRHSVQEPASFERDRVARPAVMQLFRGPLAHGTLVCATMNAAALFAWWGLFTWTPRFLSLPVAAGGHGLSIVNTSGWTIVMQLGTFLGYISFGYIAARFGQKRTYIVFLLIAAASVPVFASVANPYLLLIVGPIVGFFGTGYFSGFAVIASELFPTQLRASAMGFVYNVGRIASAAAPYLIGLISEKHGLGAALTLTSVAFLLAALIATRLRSAPRLATS
ncbi:MFS transporter [Granulicella paludicola]|uniref:MFS transporter n=1 Tax=Granulicella paludicola TaxID=474951 RepID=UPI0021DFD9B0|nr:MFS transporter [Granulicella paludicola]